MLIFETRRSAGPLARLDPRARLIAAVLFAAAAAAVSRPAAVLAALPIGMLLLGAAHMPPRRLLRNFTHINALLLMMILFLPFSWPGEALFTAGPLTYTRDGLFRALWIAVKANTIIAAVLGLIGSMEPADMAHALQRLRVPAPLTLLTAFMIRYIEVMHREYHRLRHAMLIRGFTLRFGLHELRSMAYLFGMLIVRSIDRSERIADAMKCRGFLGVFPAPSGMRYGRADAVFILSLTLFCAGLILLDTL